MKIAQLVMTAVEAVNRLGLQRSGSTGIVLYRIPYRSTLIMPWFIWRPLALYVPIRTITRDGKSNVQTTTQSTTASDTTSDEESSLYQTIQFLDGDPIIRGRGLLEAYRTIELSHEKYDDNWDREEVAELVAYKVVRLLVRLFERHGKCINWQQDVVPALQLVREVYLSRGSFSLPMARRLMRDILEDRLSHRGLRARITRHMLSKCRSDVFLYVVIVNAAARAGNGRLVWIGLRRLAWLEALPTAQLYIRSMVRITQARQRVRTDVSVLGEEASINWIEEIAKLMQDEGIEGDTMASICRLVACVRHGGRPALDESMLRAVRAQIKREESGSENDDIVSAVDPAVLKFERLFYELRATGSHAMRSLHAYVLDALIWHAPVEYALAWHLRMTRKVRDQESALSATFSLVRALRNTKMTDEEDMDVVLAQAWERFRTIGHGSPPNFSISHKNVLRHSLGACNRLLAALVRAQKMEQAVMVYDDLLVMGAVPDRYTICTMAYGCALAGLIEPLRRMCADLTRFNLQQSAVFYNVLLSVLIHRKDYTGIRNFYAGLSRDGVKLNRRGHNLLMRAASMAGDLIEIRRIYNSMLDASLEPNSRTFAHLLLACYYAANSTTVLDILREMLSRNHYPGRVVLNALLANYARQGNTILALRCYQWMCTQLPRDGVSPNLVTFVWLFRAYYWHARKKFRKKKQIKGMVEDASDLSDVATKLWEYIKSGRTLPRPSSTLQSSSPVAEKLPLFEPADQELDELADELKSEQLTEFDPDTILSRGDVLRRRQAVIALCGIAASKPYRLPDRPEHLTEHWLKALMDLSQQSDLEVVASLFQHMTQHQNITPNPLIYNTLLELFVMYQSRIHFQAIWDDLRTRCAETQDATLTAYMDLLQALSHPSSSSQA